MRRFLVFLVVAFLATGGTSLAGAPAATPPDDTAMPWEEPGDFVSMDRHFMIDRHFERMPFTVHPYGFPKRVC